MIQNGEFFSNPMLAARHEKCAHRRPSFHLFGLVSDGGVHSYQTHLYALLKMAKQQGVDRVFVHAFMDGRDTLPTNGAGYLEQLQQKMREYNAGQDRQRERPLLRHGSRPALGAHCQSFHAMVYRRWRRRQVRRCGAGS